MSIPLGLTVSQSQVVIFASGTYEIKQYEAKHKTFKIEPPAF